MEELFGLLRSQPMFLKPKQKLVTVFKISYRAQQKIRGFIFAEISQQISLNRFFSKSALQLKE